MFSDVFLGFPMFFFGFPMVSVKNPTFWVDFSPENFRLFFYLRGISHLWPLFAAGLLRCFRYLFENKQKR